MRVRLDVELLLEPVEDLVADDALIAERDQGPALGAEGLVAEPSEAPPLGGVAGAHRERRSALEPLGVDRAQALDVLAPRPGALASSSSRASAARAAASRARASSSSSVCPRPGCSARIKGVRVSPWSTSVARITREREEDDLVAVGKGRARGGRHGQGQGGGERDDAPHPDPGQQEDVAPRRNGIAPPQRGTQEPRDDDGRAAPRPGGRRWR